MRQHQARRLQKGLQGKFTLITCIPLNMEADSLPALQNLILNLSAFRKNRVNKIGNETFGKLYYAEIEAFEFK